MPAFVPVYRGVQSELTGYTLAFVVMSQPTSPSVSQHAALDDYESVSTEGFLGSSWTHISSARVARNASLMGQVPPNGTQQVTPLGQGGLSRIFFWGWRGL